ncbi:MAG: LamG domain-containing protein [Bacteroidales bacterium]|nr:LamG domain-containing protein [Bacteroidales bacterium]
MKKLFVFIIALSLGLFFSCSKEDANVTKENKATFKATTEAATKTALEEDGSVYKVVWQSGDEIVVIDGNSYIGVYSTTSTTSHAEFTYESGSEAKDPDYRAMYPVAFFNSGYPAIPATQNYVEGNISGSPMYAESSTENLAFKNICGIIRLNISTTMSGKKVRKIILGADQGMSGTVVNAATLVADGYVAAVSGTEGIVLDCGENGVAISSTAKPFHIAVPQNSYTSLSITVITTDGEYQVRTAKKNIAVTRSSITDITLAFSNMAAVGGLVNHWPFTGNAKDVVGGIDATVTGATLTTDRFGNADRAYLFENGNQMAIGDAGNFGTSSFTANLWINSTQNRSSGANMIRTDGGTGGAGWFVRFVNFGRIEIWTSGIGYTSPDTYNDGNWHMVTFVRDAENSEGKLYVDGVYIGGFTGLANVSNLYQTHYLGSYGGGEFYEGKMDDVRLYDKALTDAEILELYYIDDPYTDLSATSTANTYIVSSAGKYKFKATIKGNGGLDPITGTTATTINPSDIAGVKVLWELYGQGRAVKHDGSNYDISYSDGYVKFSTPDTFTPGNICVAVYDASDNILWSWVIWATPEPGTMTHNSKTFMDRNLGAIDVGNCMRGFLYQWGRKDAFSAADGNSYSPYTYVPAASTVFDKVRGSHQSMEYTVKHPTTWIGYADDNTWMSENLATKPWRVDVKTIYDPCPAGWRIPVKEDISGITGLPATGIHHDDSGNNDFGNPWTGYYWTASTDEGSDDRAYAFCNDGRNIMHWGQGEGYAIRPVKE